MYKASTYFIKAQLPGTTVSDLLYFYERELKDQNLGGITVEENSITFSNAMINYYAAASGNRFSSFLRGEIKILETTDEFPVFLEADISRIFILPGIVGGCVSAFFLFSSGFNAGVLIFGVFIFIVIALIRYLSLVIGFPVYFVSLRNNIENDLQNSN